MAGKTTDTRDRLLDAAREEFLEYGFENASLRRMAKTVGIAAPSVYNHFSSKEDMFAALVEPVIQMVKETFLSVDEEKLQNVKNKQADEALDKANTMKPVLDFAFDHLDDVRLLLFSAEGTKYQGILDKVAEMEANATCRVMTEAGYPPFTEEQQEEMFCVMRHQYQMYAEAIKNGWSKERTWNYWKRVSSFYTEGWKKLLFGEEDSKNEIQ